MKEKGDRRNLTASETDRIQHERRVQYEKALRRAFKAAVVLDVALSSVEAFAPFGEDMWVKFARQNLAQLDRTLRKVIKDRRIEAVCRREAKKASLDPTLAAIVRVQMIDDERDE